MNQAIYFKTSMFDVSKESENPINPIYGSSLLFWLREELKGTYVITEPDSEDWGWYSELEYQGRNYLIGASSYFEQGDDPSQELEWVFQIDKYRSIKEKIFGKNKMTSEDCCLLFFKKLFDSHPEIKEVEVG